MSNEKTWSGIIRSRKQEILDEWMAKVRVRVPAAKYQEQYALMNSIPLVLDAMATLLTQQAVPVDTRHLEHDLACVHGLARSQQDGYTPEQIAQEYSILRSVLIETLEHECGELPRRIHELILDTIDAASHSAQQTLMRAQLVRENATPEAWHLSEARYRMIVEEVEEYAIFMIDINGHIASWNKGTFKIKGYLPHQIIGLPFRVLFVEEDATIGRAEWELEYAVKHGRFTGEGWRQRQDGSRFWASVVLTALRNDAGELVGWCKITRDLTAEKRAEEELRKAEAATRAKSAFLANMSHEIRTPLGVIMGFADLLQEAEIPFEERSEFSATIRRNGEQLVALIDDILDLSKVEAGKLAVEKEQFLLTEFLIDIQRTLQFKAQEKGLKLEIESFSGTPQAIVSDRFRLRQILLNVVGNAIKFTDQGKVRIEIESRPASEPSVEDKILFYVSDTGIGIAPEFQKRLFEAFTQAHVTNTNTRLFGGTGLGLALSRELSRALGGDLMLVESRPGEGSIFLITIDAGRNSRETWIVDPSGGVKPILRTNLATLEAKQLEGARILLAEDSTDNQRLISSFLRSAGAEVDIVSDGAMAVAKVESDSYDLILMDIQMPKMNGLEATAWLRQNQCTLPIVALTAFAMKEDRERGQTAGFDDYLTKPVNRAALLKTINGLTVKGYRKVTEATLKSFDHSSGEPPRTFM